MAQQFIVKGANRDQRLRDLLFSLDEHIELFALDGHDTGVSVPTKVTDRIGDSRVREVLSQFQYYDLWSGDWHVPEPPNKGRISWSFGGT